MRASFLTLALPLTICIAACQKENEFDNQTEQTFEGTVELSLSLPEGGVTRTYLGERVENTFPILWAEGDKVSLGGTESTPVSAEQAGRKESTFAFRGSIVKPYNILYPATTESDKVVFPTEQKYHEGSFDPKAFPMYASCEDYSNASMHHLGTLLGFQLTASGEETSALKQLIIMSVDGKVLSGTFALATSDNGAFTGEFASSEGATTATLDFPEGGLALGNEPVTAWISLPHGEYPKGFTMLVVDTQEKAMMLSFMTKEDATDVLEAGTALLFPPVSFSPGEGIFIIDEPEDLIKLSSESDAHPEVLVAKDIDMSAVEDWTPIDGFTGIFNGAGHTISGLDKAIFGTLSGEVRNLTVSADIQTSQTMTALFANEITSEGNIYSCTAKGSITVVGDLTEYTYLGGFAAKNSGSFSSSTSEVKFNIPAETTGKPLFIGGFAGYSTGGSFSKLTSKSSIECAGTIGNSFYGGIAGYVLGEEQMDITSCQSAEGSTINITYPTSGTPQMRFSGLFGYLKTNGISFSDCVNNTCINVVVPEGVTKSNMFLGGIAANSHLIAGTSKFIGCTNNGDINLIGHGRIGENSPSKRPCSMGGIVAKCQIEDGAKSTEIIVEDCTNNGDITLTSNDPEKYCQIAYIGGICADAYASKISDLRCVNTGNMSITGFTDRCSMGGHIGTVYPLIGEKVSLSIVGKGEEPVNTGILAYYDRAGENIQRHPVAAGVIGIIMSSGETVPVEFSIKDCTNSGMIDRLTPTSSVFVEAASYEASAGGIVGNIGFQSSTDGYSDVTGVIENCSNTAQITINAFTHEDAATFVNNDHIEKTASQSFIGGIVGFSHPKKGLVTVKNCSNSGYMRHTAGNAGGIVGRIQSNTIVTGTNYNGNVTYTTNTGRVGEFGLDKPLTHVSTGYAYSGGIVGALIYSDSSDQSKIEYCHNAGDISGSHTNSNTTGKGTARPTAGGIIGQYDFGRDYAAVRWCKNSGHVRCYRSFTSSSTYYYSGLISGSDICMVDEVGNTLFALISDCAIGGLCVRAGGWTSPTAADGEYPYYDYIYCYQTNMTWELSPTTEDGKGYAEGCEVWDGTSKTSWEK